MRLRASVTPRWLSLLSLAFAIGVCLCAPALAELPLPTDPAPADPLEGQQGWLGIGLRQLTPEEAKALGFDAPIIEVTQVFEGSPAHTSGFEVGDHVVSFDGHRVSETSALINIVRNTRPGSKVSVERLRAGKTEAVPLLLGVRPDAYALLRDQLVDKPHPPLSLLTLKGSKPFDVTALKGKVVLIDFWATWCGPCRMTLPGLASLHSRFAEKGLVVVGVTDEQPADIERFLTTTPIPYAVALDPDAKTNTGFLVNALPTLIVIDRKGIIREVFIGADDAAKVEATILPLLAE
jgi:thiol-disulfide isomerase/thioredoxin